MTTKQLTMSLFGVRVPMRLKPTSQTTMPSKANLPDFIGIGAQRAGTSWMYQCLSSHPEVFMPRKEIHFFNGKFDRGLTWYEEHFKLWPPGARVCGEFTPNYLGNDDAITRIGQYIPNAKLICVLREPVSRAFSAFNMLRSHGHYQGVTFEDAMRPGSDLVRQGLYGRQLELVFERFASDHVKLFLYEEIETAASRVVKELYQFIGVEPDFVPDTVEQKINMSGFSGSQKFFRLPQLQKAIGKSVLGPTFHRLKGTQFANWVRNRIYRQQRQHSSEIVKRDEFKSLFREDLEKLEGLIERDLSAWK